MSLRLLRFAAVATIALLPLSHTTSAQISKVELESISIPDRVDTAIGELKFFDGVPTDATIDRLYDNLDRSRGVRAYLDNVSAGSIHAMRTGSASIGANASNKVTITEQLLLPKMLALTGNTSTLVFLRGSVAKGLAPAVENIKSKLKFYTRELPSKDSC